MENKTKIRVCVIGGGAGGLICSKRLLEKKNIIVESYERSNNVGGLWVYDDGPNGKMYTSLRANTCKILMAFPEYPMPEEWPEFPSHWMMAEYLQGFANTFLKGVYRTSTTILGWDKIKSNNNNSNSNNSFQYKVYYKKTNNNKISNDDEHVQPSFAIYDKIVICSGQASIPFTPNYKGIETFKGRIFHSSEYRNSSLFPKRRVMVCGAGYASGSDICQDVSFAAKQTYLSSRRGFGVTKRFAFGKDLAMGPHGPAWRQYVPGYNTFNRYITMKISEWMKYLELGDQPKKFGYRPYDRKIDGKKVFSFVTDSNHILHRISLGAVKVVPDIEEIYEHSVKVKDGREIEIDDLIFATGYNRSFNHQFSKPLNINGKEKPLRLYNYVFKDDDENIAFVLACHPVGPHWPLASLQSRWIAKVFSGEMGLPNTAEQEKYMRIVKNHQAESIVYCFSEIERLGKSLGWDRPTLLQLLNWYWTDYEAYNKYMNAPEWYGWFNKDHFGELDIAVHTSKL